MDAESELGLVQRNDSFGGKEGAHVVDTCHGWSESEWNSTSCGAGTQTSGRERTQHNRKNEIDKRRSEDSQVCDHPVHT